MKFRLLFLPNGRFTCVPEAYICATPSSRYEPPDPLAGLAVLTNECTSAAECHAEIDKLIDQLNRLKAAASEKFAAMPKNTRTTRSLKGLRLASLVLLCTSALLIAQTRPTEVKIGFGTGNDYRAYDKAQRLPYAEGFVNGLLLAPIFDAPKDKTKWIEEFVTGMSNGQVAAIINKFMDDNPGRWHEPLNLLSFTAIKEAYAKAHPPGAN